MIYLNAASSMLAITVICSILRTLTKRAEVAEWLAVRLLAYRDAVLHRRAQMQSWKRSMQERAELERIAEK